MCSIFSLLPLLLALPLIAAQDGVTRGNIFIGCASSPGQYYSSKTLGVFGSSGGCASHCASDRPGAITYSAYQRSTKNCVCTSNPPTANKITASSSTAGSSSCSNAGDYSFFNIYTSYTFDRCYSSQDIGPSIRVETIGNCLNYCRKSEGLQIRAVAGDNLYTCTCPSAADLPITPTECGSSGATVYRYIHPYAAASAGASRKRRDLLRNSKMTSSHCPAGLKACKVPGVLDENAFECIDVLSELESCGGCVAGEYGVEASSEPEVKGVNCILGDNAEFSTITCKAGQCVNEQVSA